MPAETLSSNAGQQVSSWNSLSVQISPISSTSGWPQNQQGATGEGVCRSGTVLMRACLRLARRQ